MGSGCAGISSHGKLLETVGPHAAMSKLSYERSAVRKQSERIYSKILLSKLDLSEQ